MQSLLVLCLTPLLPGLWSPQVQAPTGTPAGAHNPVSMVDTGDGLALFGPPNYPSGPSYLGPTNHQIGSGSLNIGDGWPENFLYVEPLPAPTQPVPLVVMFHKFGSTQNDLTFNTNFPAEAGAQGWYLVCPLAANTQHFGSLPSQVHMEAVILDMLVRYPLIDRNRIYAVGFSMGGGAVANYAARHLNPAKPMFASMVAMSGGFALKHTYYSDVPVRPFLDFWYGNGGAGSADPWKMARSSAVNFDPITLVVENTEDLARNLLHIPMRIVRPIDDPVPYLPVQGDVMAAHMQTLGATVGPNFDYKFVPFGWDAYDHKWSMLDSHWAFNWMGTHTLTLPTSASTLADRDDTYFHFFVEQDAAGAFTPFTWNIDVPNNTLSFSATANLKRLTVDTLGAGINPLLQFTVNLATADGLADDIVITSVPSKPISVLRDTLPTSSWNYNATLGELTLLETDGLPHQWVITP